MGIRIYWYIVAAVIILGQIMPQHGKERKHYIILMTAIHVFVCGWRYKYLTGDLQKYAYVYYRYVNEDVSWMSIFNGGRNFGFEWLRKAFSMATDGDFQIFLIFIAFVVGISLAIVIYRYSSLPWLSFLMWDCVGFYVFGFSAIKQALAMALLMFAYVGIMEDKPKKFLFWTLIAGAIHMPALIFIPAYWIAKAKFNRQTIMLFIAAAALIFIFRAQVIDFFSDIYYEETDFASDTNLGGRFIMICLLLVGGILIKGFRDEVFRKTFGLIAVAAVLQMFSGYDNVFTRLTDYYLQFLVIYVPLMMYDSDRMTAGAAPKIAYDPKLKPLIIVAIVVFSIWFYKNSSLVPIAYAVDDYTNYRFCWEVVNSL